MFTESIAKLESRPEYFGANGSYSAGASFYVCKGPRKSIVRAFFQNKASRAIIIKSLVLSTALPADILLQNSQYCLEFDVPQFQTKSFLQPVLSSIITADTPIRSRVRTLYT